MSDYSFEMNWSRDGCCVRCSNAMPAIFLYILIIWSYYVYIIEMCVLKIWNNMAKFISYVVFSAILFIMMNWAYIATMCTPTATPPSKYYVPDDLALKLRLTSSIREADRQELLKQFIKIRNIIVWTRLQNGNIRYCYVCRLVKPDRAHHCSTCKICVLKMDHHCPWANCCICYSNYKMFLLFLFYSFLYCTFYAGTTTEFVYSYWFFETPWNYRELQITMGYCFSCKCIMPDRAHHCSVCKICILKMYHHCILMNTCIGFNNYKMFILFIFYTLIYCLYVFAACLFDTIEFFKHADKTMGDCLIVTGCFLSALVCILCVSILSYHMKLICKNRTPKEDRGSTYFIYKEPLTFYISRCFNWKQTFGEFKLLWCLPVSTTSGNGTEFYTNMRK